MARQDVFIVGLLASTAALSGCGGGGTDVASIPPLPASAQVTVSPPPANTTDPGASVAYKRGYSGPPPGLVLESGIPANSSEDGWKIAFDAATGTYTLSRSDSLTVASFDLQSSTLSQGPDFATYNRESDSDAARLDVFRSGVVGGDNSRLHLNYLSYALWSRTDDTYGPSDHFFVFGTPTDRSDVPRTGTATFNGVVDGYYGSYRLEGSTGSLTADFGRGTIATTLTLQASGERLPFASELGPIGAFALGTLTGTGTIGGNSNAYHGSLSGSLQGTAVTGTLAGGFFGPGAAETGFAFGVNSTAGATSNVAAAGVFVGH